ncbi:glycosyltransferase [Antarcticibacterium flavum]|uniref:Glycosyltransferase n=1 Tax=Antarcticibacterium flavum TaxID=2058175 RepID=A0A5B7X3P3_9FLAO|nr:MULTISPECIES: glycosyltransferase [Antarcticibacterium]MCM4161441.1 glycosyltransferase [Antarcticibacterium sp. W02-3]QCY69321.1 glycosyltransferase [Antarcticibacterium flavum]
MKFVIIGLSVTSSWGNGHATTYRALLRELANLGHEILFLEKDVPWYSGHRDMPQPTFCELGLYKTNEELKSKYREAVAGADVVIVGSYVQQGVEVGNWAIDTATGATAFYDIDTPVTLAKLERQDYEYLDPATIGRYDMYLSFSGGPILEHLEQHYGSPMAKALYCSVDTKLYFPEEQPLKWQMGYLGTYSDDRQPTVENLLNKAAAHFPEEEFVVAGPQYPKDISWSQNVQRIEHLPPAQHRKFYNSQKFTLNVTREDMIKAGYSPSVRLFEAAACGVPIISDHWDGIESIFEPGKEILIAHSTEDVLEYFFNISEEERKQIGINARTKVLKYHTAKARARELVDYVDQLKETSKV